MFRILHTSTKGVLGKSPITLETSPKLLLNTTSRYASILLEIALFDKFWERKCANCRKFDKCMCADGRKCDKFMCPNGRKCEKCKCVNDRKVWIILADSVVAFYH